ncbi:MAG: type II toxin-antitoxin system RelE/ParE family toxin [Planctomycetaceae bacterium]|nr:type II toxin-antitoxin system RelE/ParE family toxin [Planctomycetaceae bacterium]
MARSVRFSSTARQDVHDIVAYIHEDSPANALQWRQRLYEKLKILRSERVSFALAPENEFARCEVRQFLFGRYRVLYTTREEEVFILTVRHGSRIFMSGEEIDRVDT